MFYEGTSTESGVPGSQVNVAIEATAIPEPTSMALLIGGMAGLFTYRRMLNNSIVHTNRRAIAVVTFVLTISEGRRAYCLNFAVQRCWSSVGVIPTWQVGNRSNQ